MSLLARDLTGAEVLRPGQGLVRDRLSISDGHIVDAPVGRAVDLSGFWLLPGIVDVHGDGFERHLAPRRGAMKQVAEGLVAAEAELAANGITTAVLAQFMSWEGGLRGVAFADRVLSAIRDTRDQFATDLIAQLRFEIHMLDHYADLPARVRDWQVGYLVFNDHLPHQRLAQGKRPAGLTGQALKAGRNPEAHLQFLQDLYARRDEVAAALDAVAPRLLADGVRLGSHDEATAEDRAIWRRRGAAISEFPETLEAAEAACAVGEPVILGAPNVVRGGSHKGNVSATDLIVMGHATALASDYHYPSPRRAVLMLERAGVVPLETAWGLIAEGPARVLGLADRGVLRTGARADLVILDARTKRVAGTLAGGQVSYLSGEAAARFAA